MSPPLLTHHRANLFSALLLFVGILILYLSDYLLSGVPLILGVIIALRQALRGRFYDIIITLIVFGGTFASYGLDEGWTVAIPVALATAACYLILREFLIERQRVGVEAVEDLSHELEEEQHDKYPHE